MTRKSLRFRFQEQAPPRSRRRALKQQQQETFGFSEPGVPVIPAASTWAGTQSQTGTLTNGNNQVTALTATAQLVVGMPVTASIAGVPPGAVIGTIASGTQVNLTIGVGGPAANFTGTTGSATVTFSAFDSNQTIWGGGGVGQWLGFPSPPLSAIATDAPDCPFNIPDSQSVLAGATFVPAPGRGIITMAQFTTTAGTVQYNVNGTWTSVIFGSTAAASSGYTMADGVNVRFNNLGSATVVYIFYRERSSKSSSI